ncbi:MAG TPA: hypothetical protein VN709_05280 [Terriglobales bacterium]|nr:hypothetical protein [Terriglobales bacterium]
MHDMTHFAVETALGCRQGFFGLIAAGWEIDDTMGLGARGSLPAQALEVESIVGALDSERACGGKWSAADFNQFLPRRLSPAELERVRATRAALFERWHNLPTGESLRMDFAAAQARPGEQAGFA